MLIRWRDFDWFLLGGLIFLATASLAALLSFNPDLFRTQLVWYAISFLVIIAGSQINWRTLINQSWFRYVVYWASVALLVFVYLQPHTIRGIKGWIVFGEYQFQVSELAKLALILILAGFFSRRYIEAWRGRNIFVSFVYSLIPAVLIAIEPDFGSAIVIMGIWVGFLIINGFNKKKVLIGLFLGVVMAILLWSFVLAPYQKERLISFIFPERDPLGASYNIIQSKIAIGSAGFWGKGFREGTQTQLLFLPEAHTDFIFSAFIEEWGMAGGFFLILSFVLIIYRITAVGLISQDNYAKFICLGGGFVLLIQFFMNTGSAVGLLPVTGINFPFFSYGGSNLLTMAIIVSIIEHIKLESSK